MSVAVAAPRRKRCLRVMLVSMPMAAIQRPSIQIGLLAAIGRRAGHQVDTLHANLEFAAVVNSEVRPGRPPNSKELVEDVLAVRDPYSRLAEHRGAMFGEWIFSLAAFGSDAPAAAEVVLRDDRAPTGVIPEFTEDFLLRVRNEIAPAFIERLHGSIDWAEYDVVGFSSTFHQNCASFALAKSIKTSHPSVLTVFGGANFESTMGLEFLRSVSAVDLVVRGEADATFPALLDAISIGADPLGVAGVALRVHGEVVANEPAAPFDNLNSQPLPIYDEFFDRADRLGLVPAVARRFIDIPFESARGCWWGAKRHCTFCGLNGLTMGFRSKDAALVRDELDSMARRYGSFRFTAVDNIMDCTYLDTLLPELRGYDFDLFYEVKADLSPAQLRTMREAGVRRIQPGIESLSSHVLGLMRKGTRAAWNVNLLRWCRFLGIDVSWNILWGFPGERAEHYAEQAALVPSLVHLQPPGSFGPIWLERFSPLFRENDECERGHLRPEHSYMYVYPESVDLRSAAYFFEAERPGALPESAYGPLSAVLGQWKNSWPDRVPELTIQRSPGFVQILDTRSGEVENVHTLEGVAARLYDATMESPSTASSIAEQLRAPRTAVQSALDALCAAGLTMRDRNLYLSLAIPPLRRARDACS